MKTRGAAVRFVLVSATVPNIQDVATWIGTNGSISKPATVLEESQTWYDVSLCLSGTSLVKSIGPVNSPESWLASPVQRGRTILCFPKSWTASYLQRYRHTQWESPFWSFAQQEMVIRDWEISSTCLKFLQKVYSRRPTDWRKITLGRKARERNCLGQGLHSNEEFLINCSSQRSSRSQQCFYDKRTSGEP